MLKRCQKIRTKTGREKIRRIRRASKSDAVYFELHLDFSPPNLLATLWETPSEPIFFIKIKT